MATSAARHSANTEYYARGDFVPGLWVDGMDVLAVREGTKYAIDHCTSGKGPIVLEMATYRYVSHSMSDPGTSYRTREEIQEVRQTRDSIHHLKDKILENNWSTNQELKDIEHDIKKEVDRLTNVARSDPGTKMDELVTDIYQKPDFLTEVRNVVPLQELKHKNVGIPKNL